MRKKLPYDHTFDFRGAKINYQIIGSGPPIIFIHGSFSHDAFLGAEKELGKSFKTYLLHLPGFGGSDSIKGAVHNSSLFAEALEAFIDHSGLHEAPIIGLSLGAVVAIKAAYNGATQGPLLLIGVPAPASGFIVKATAHLPRFLKRFLSNTFLGKKYLILPAIRANITKKNSPEIEKHMMRLLSQTDAASIADIDYQREFNEVPDLLAHIDNQIFYIYGENDVMKTKTAHFTKNHIIVPNAGHNIFVLNPHKSVEIIKQLLFQLKVV